MSDTQAVTEADTQVVVNDEEQYSIWPAGRDLPSGWQAVGFVGSERSTSLTSSIWTDMRPKSLRDAER